jgi:hypothetical protein
VPLKQSLTPPPRRKELHKVQICWAFSFGDPARLDGPAFLEGMKMKHQVQYGTDSGIVSKEAAKKIRMFVADLTRTIQILESDMATKKTRTLDTRRHNLIDTIVCLEDRLGSIEHLRACKYERTNSNLPHAPAAPPH